MTAAPHVALKSSLAEDRHIKDIFKTNLCLFTLKRKKCLRLGQRSHAFIEQLTSIKGKLKVECGNFMSFNWLASASWSVVIRQTSIVLAASLNTLVIVHQMTLEFICDLTVTFIRHSSVCVSLFEAKLKNAHSLMAEWGDLGPLSWAKTGGWGILHVFRFLFHLLVVFYSIHSSGVFEQELGLVSLRSCVGHLVYYFKHSRAHTAAHKSHQLSSVTCDNSLTY